MVIQSYVLRPLDILRACILSYSLRNRFIRSIFISRYFRTLTLFGMSFFLNLVLMLYFPLWTLVLVPGLLGMPHLINSLGTFHQTASPPEWVENSNIRKKITNILLLSSISIATLRLVILFVAKNVALTQILDTSVSSVLPYGLRAAEFGIMIASFIFFLQVYQIPISKRIRSLLILIISSIAMLIWSNILLGLFIVSHNFMAFYYWYLHAPSKKEKKLSIFGLFLFCMTHILVLSNYFDSILQAIAVDQGITTQLFGYSFAHISSDLFPTLYDLDLSRKIVMLLCFGQGIHYFLWIKVIPECRLGLEKSIPFRASFRCLQKQWGDRKAVLLLLMAIGFFIAANVIRIDLVNEIFFSIAFYHIYMEYLALFVRGSHFPNRMYR
jgi:hypothetical protein